MDNFINKLTLYDLISFSIPGSIDVLCICLFFQNEIKVFLDIINNDFFAFIIFAIASYCLGWLVSDLMNLLTKKYKNNNKKEKKNEKTDEKNDKKIDKKNLYKYEIIKILTLFIGIYFFQKKVIIWIFGYVLGWVISFVCFIIKEFNYLFYFLLYAVIGTVFYFFQDNVFIEIIIKVLFLFVAILIFIIYIKKFIIGHNTKSDELQKLCLKSYEYIKKEFPSLESTDDNQKEKNVKLMSNYAFSLIQTESKYTRIHNYNSSKSFSKNLMGSSLFIAISQFILFLQTNGIKFDMIYFISGNIFLWSSLLFYNRYKSFEEKVNIYTASYFIDYMKDKSNKDKSNKDKGEY